MSPFLLVFAISTFLFNHGWVTEYKPVVHGVDEVAEKSVVVPPEMSGVDRAKRSWLSWGYRGKSGTSFEGRTASRYR